MDEEQGFATPSRWKRALALLCATSVGALTAIGPRAEAAPAKKPPVRDPVEVRSERKLLCARIEMATDSIQPDGRVDLEEEAAEGGGAELFARDDHARIHGALLGESQREHFDYLFYKDDLVCARVTTTSVWTVMGKRDDNPDGVPPWWRADFRVFAGGKVIHATIDRAPGQDDHASRADNGDELARYAKALLAKLRAKPKPDVRKK